MDDLPDLPFEQMLSYLTLEDRLKARNVSKGWRKKFDNYPVKSLCYSDRPSGFIWRKGRWVTGAFAQNFIFSTKFDSFFNAFGPTILSNLKQLRFCDLNEENTPFASILNSFCQLEKLEELDIIRLKCSQQRSFSLKLPALTSIHLEEVRGVNQLTLDASRLCTVRLRSCCSLKLDIVHGESVERLLSDYLAHTEVKWLKGLRYLSFHSFFRFTKQSIDPTFLSCFEQLKEVHLNDSANLSELFEQKRRYGRTDLKIYFDGLLINPEDPVARYSFVRLAEYPSRLADEMPFYDSFYSSEIAGVDPKMAIDLMKRFTGLRGFCFIDRVQDIESFLNLLKNLDNGVELLFWCDQPQELFDRLPEHSIVQKLILYCKVSDIGFLFRMKHLIQLLIMRSIGGELIRRLFDELPYLLEFEYRHFNKYGAIKVLGNSRLRTPRFQVTSYGSDLQREEDELGSWNLDAAIRFLIRKIGGDQEVTKAI